MRRCIVGPCTEAEKQAVRDGLEYWNEPIESMDMWDFLDTSDPAQFNQIAFEMPSHEWTKTGNDVYGVSTITAADFIKTYLQP